MAATLLGSTIGLKNSVSVAASANGKAHLVYAGADGKIHYRRWNGKEWLADETLPAPAAKNYHPVVIAPNGALQVVFVSQLGDGSSSYAIFYTTRKAKAWSAPTRLTTESHSQLPRFMVDANGALHLVYNRFGSNPNEILYKRNDGSSWSSAEKVGEGFYPDLAVDANGNAHVLWNDAAAIRGRVRSANGVWGETFKVGSSKKPELVAIAFDTAGTLHHVWQTREEDVFRSLTYARRGADGSLTISKQVQGGGIKLVFYPRLTLDCMNRARIVFQGKFTNQGSEPNRVYQRIFDGTTWSEPTRLDAPELQGASQIPEIDANGTTLVAGWINGDDDKAYGDVMTIACGGTLTAMAPTKSKTAKPKTRVAAKKKPVTKPKRKVSAKKKKG